MGIRIYSIPTRTGVMMRGSRHRVTQRSFFTRSLAHRASLQGAVGHRGEGSGGPQGHAGVCSSVGVQLLILQLPKCLDARRDGLHWERHSTG